ncbi:hypothetical protein C8035_v003964 [Colletotrichum spinosum]|uniref:Uncharacterized protein n=1 Tax=Colletotrichum spinosum TaxID=1347390 RepID=A0A4R8PT15_9PEZI|nr:hypothetical protein C8035_v003964 [Colletotrichum spinosum]
MVARLAHPDQLPQTLTQRDPQRPPNSVCVDRICAAEKVVRTTIGGNCVTACSHDCNIMVSAGNSANIQKIQACSLGNRDFVNAEGVFVLTSTIDPLCDCKYCTCKCPYTVDNIVYPARSTCTANTLCGLIVNGGRGWTVTVKYSGTPYGCQ